MNESLHSFDSEYLWLIHESLSIFLSILRLTPIPQYLKLGYKFILRACHDVQVNHFLWYFNNILGYRFTLYRSWRWLLLYIGVVWGLFVCLFFVFLFLFFLMWRSNYFIMFISENWNDKVFWSLPLIIIWPTKTWQAMYCEKSSIQFYTSPPAAPQESCDMTPYLGSTYFCVWWFCSLVMTYNVSRMEIFGILWHAARFHFRKSENCISVCHKVLRTYSSLRHDSKCPCRMKEGFVPADVYYSTASAWWQDLVSRTNKNNKTKSLCLRNYFLTTFLAKQ